jgi:hypothetical protein
VVVAAAVAVMASKITLITAHHLMYNVYASKSFSAVLGGYNCDALQEQR